MTPQEHNSAWKRTWVIVSGIGLPILCILFWAIVFGTRSLDKLDAVAAKQSAQDTTIERLDRKWEQRLNALQTSVDAIQLWQHDFTLLNPKRRSYSSSQAHFKPGVLIPLNYGVLKTY